MLAKPHQIVYVDRFWFQETTQGIDTQFGGITVRSNKLGKAVEKQVILWVKYFFIDKSCSRCCIPAPPHILIDLCEPMEHDCWCTMRIGPGCKAGNSCITYQDIGQTLQETLIFCWCCVVCCGIFIAKLMQQTHSHDKKK